MRLAAVLAFALLAFAPAGAGAHGYKLGAIEIGHVWAPPSKDGKTSVFGPLLNTGGAPDALVGVSSPAARDFTIRDKDGTATLDRLPLPPMKPVSLATWGAHIVLTGVTRPLVRGGAFDLTLRFAKAGTITVKVLVQTSAADEP